jgi:hypothetical protein
MTYGTCCGQSNHTAPSPPGHRSEHILEEQGMHTPALQYTCTKSFHKRPQRAQDPPEDDSGRTLRHSSVAGTAPTGPGGTEGKKVPQHDNPALTHCLRVARRKTKEGPSRPRTTPGTLAGA